MDFDADVDQVIGGYGLVARQVGPGPTTVLEVRSALRLLMRRSKMDLWCVTIDSEGVLDSKVVV